MNNIKKILNYLGKKNIYIKILVRKKKNIKKKQIE